MRGMALAIAVIATACVQSKTDVCSDGSLCPEGRQCYAVASTQTIECVTPEQIADCNGEDDGVACGTAGTCFSGACLPAGCNNRRIDPGEACDDGNNVPGDGCSADCRSNETCGNGIIDPVRQVGGMFVLDEQCDDQGFLGHDGCSSACSPETPRASTIAKTPRRRVNAAMATDPDRRRIIMFGGRVGLSELARSTNETWELDEEGWVELRLGVSPGPRAQHAMVYDGTQIVMFGGGDVAQAFADTWTFADDRWSLVSTPTAPPARLNHAMAFLPGTGVVLLGGENEKGEVRGDMWIFAQGAWTQFGGPLPPARTNHTLTFDPMRQVLVLTTGTDMQGLRVVDTWEFDGSTWTQVVGPDAPDVYSAAAEFDATRGQVLLTGGFNSGTIINSPHTSSLTWGWNGQAWSIVASDSPDLMDLASASDPITGQMMVFGGLRIPLGPPCGACPDVFDTTHRLEGSSWRQRPFEEILTMRGASASNDPLRRRVVLYTPTGATYERGNGSWIPQSVAGPPARSNAAMAYGRFGTSPVSILFGGITGTAIRSDSMWTWNGSAWTARAPSLLPPARSRHAMAYDARRGRTIVVGGITSNGPVGDSWAWDGSAWSMLGGVQPSPRADHAMAYDPIRDVVLLFGGGVGTDPIGDFWQLDGTGWSRIEPPFGPAPRYGGAMAWDASRQRIVLFGGTPAFDTWEWDGATWTFVNTDTPETRTEFPMVSSPSGDGVIAIGGLLESGDVLKDTLNVAWSTGFAGYAACRAAGDDDGDGRAACDDPDCWTTCTPLCPPGSTCEPTAPRCGDGMCDAPRERCGICSDCPCPN